MNGRAEIVQAIQTLAAEWRGRSMSDEAQAQFDDLTRSLDAYDEGAVALEQAARQSKVPVPLAERFTRRRVIASAGDRAVAVQDMQALAAEYRARSMPFEAQSAFDRIVAAIEDYDARCKAIASAPPDPRDSVLAAMRVAARGGSPW
ncbi:hypothetical protein [Methylobacterium sp. P5_C11]